MKRGQVLEKVKRIPINITACIIQFRVNVGWCGREFAISSYTHNDIETLRDTIIEDFEMRVSDLENKMSWFSKVFISDKDSNTPMRLQIETRA